ncbi:YnfA family protein [Ameyamaea chiangmaiensis]|nr:YnfA family protein [Ameyamaea chiangmaiensis]MBS4075988.1 YnfA family protein [Ameyamaea chiangmaiensis]
MSPALVYLPAAIAEISGCYALWAWLRLGRSALWLIPGAGALAAFATLLALSPADNAGRAYATYGGIYIAASVLWSWWVDDVVPDRWDIGGAAVCLAGSALILFGPRSG